MTGQSSSKATVAATPPSVIAFKTAAVRAVGLGIHSAARTACAWKPGPSSAKVEENHCKSSRSGNGHAPSRSTTCARTGARVCVEERGAREMGGHRGGVLKLFVPSLAC